MTGKARTIERAMHTKCLNLGGVGASVQSFYEWTDPTRYTAVVTNPPFDQCNWKPHKARWIRHAIDVLKVPYMALLLPWMWPAAGGMAEFYEAHKPARIYLMRWRIDFTNQGAPPIQHCWVVWDRAYHGETVLRMLDRPVT